MLDPIKFSRPIFEQINSNKIKDVMEDIIEHRLLTLPSESKVLADFVDSKGDRFTKIIEDGLEKTIIHKKDGTHYYGSMRNGKVVELSETKPNSIDTYFLRSRSDGGYTETSGDYHDLFISTYDKNGRLVKLTEEKFDINKPAAFMDTKLTLDDKGTLKGKDTTSSIIDSTQEVLDTVKNADKQTQIQSMPIINEFMTNLQKMFNRFFDENNFKV